MIKTLDPRKLTISAFLMTSSTMAGIYEPKAIWKTDEIKVCFFDGSTSISKAETQHKFRPTELSRSEKDIVELVINENYNLQDTGVSFTGWDSCTRIPDFDVVVMKAKPIHFLFNPLSFYGVASFGDARIFSTLEHRPKNQDRYSIVALSDFSPFIIAHEFGHVLGLYHEHEHVDSYKDPQCIKAKMGRSKGPLPQAVVHTLYDPGSVMNYCSSLSPENPKRDTTNIKVLSDMDRETLIHLYGK